MLETEHRTGMASLLEEKRAICARVTARPPAYSMPKTQRKRLKQAGGQDFALKRSKKVPSFGENSAFFETYLSKAQAIEVVEMCKEAKFSEMQTGLLISVIIA